MRNVIHKDGWTITHDTKAIDYRGVSVAADLAAERTLAAERDGELIAVEIKSSVGLSTIRDIKSHWVDSSSIACC